MGRVQFFVFILLSTFLLAGATENSHSANATSTKEVAINRKERLNPLAGLSGGLLNLLGSGGGQGSGSSSGGSGSGLSLQNGLKGIQSIQKFVSRFQNIMGHPFSFRGVSDTMATMTGLLAAVGGGYLTYVSMVALFGSMMDPQNTAYQHAYSSPPYQYAPPQHINANGLHAAASSPQGYNRRQSSDSSGLYFGSHDIGKMFRSVTNFN
ncbi:hypothetical protein AVEN_35098-1, partial [Araneus ventricosus]